MTTALLIATGIILIVAVLALVYRIINLVGIAKEDSNKVTFSNKINGALFPILLVVGLGLIYWSYNDASQYFLPEAASLHGKETDALFNITLGVVFAAFVVTHLLLFTFPFFFQYSEKRKADFYPHNDKLEIAWTAVPAIVMAVLVIFGWRAWADITAPASDSAIQVELMGKQFAWEIRYPGKDLKLGKYNVANIDNTNSMGIDFDDVNANDDFMAREIVLPVGKEVELKIRAIDVIHSVFLPHFRVKMDAVPGMPTRFKFTPSITTSEMRTKTNNPKFNYELACTEVCGYGHFGMRRIVKIVSQAEYDEWLMKQKSWLEKNPDYMATWEAKKAEKEAVAQAR
ncbi:cytochrome c oxidase subunit II [Flammeovirga pectinis]|uniref:Cytochrome c oxidase subunit 2 n=1 Tax=Flammeovirga pectinis TaxID=2494373 RepID=A0A3S9P2Y8_9BACT|nr:cytochrome c oxidase subunit II [Flammeovirga pectinis]AZQ62567.1 cytochrome c oxidase subunit II [Flammeovirga pectinis]